MGAIESHRESVTLPRWDTHDQTDLEDVTSWASHIILFGGLARCGGHHRLGRPCLLCSLNCLARLHGHTIDDLFGSLARHAGPRSIGVIRSGALGDGAKGLAEINQAGGITMVQTPDDAEFASMPEGAIAYDGIVDVIARPQSWHARSSAACTGCSRSTRCGRRAPPGARADHLDSLRSHTIRFILQGFVMPSVRLRHGGSYLFEQRLRIVGLRDLE